MVTVEFGGIAATVSDGGKWSMGRLPAFEQLLNATFGSTWEPDELGYSPYMPETQARAAAEAFAGVVTEIDAPKNPTKDSEGRPVIY